MEELYDDIIDNLIVLRIVIAVAILIGVFTIGSVGFHLIEGMSLFDGVYMSFITITTIGFAEVSSLSKHGRMFTIVVFLMGFGIISYIVSQSTQLVIESEIFRKRTMKKQLQKMQDHYIIAGYGRIGHRVAEVLKEAGISLVVIENKESSVERIRDNNHLHVAGDAQDEDVLKQAGIEDAKGIICSLSRDQDNVFVTLIARELNPNIFILVRTNEHQNTRKILRAGADKVISPYEIGADRMANVILRPHVDQFINRIQCGPAKSQMQDHVFDEIRVFEGSPLDGKTLAEAKIRQKYFVAIIAIAPKLKHNIHFNPASDDKISAGDSLIVLGDVGRIKHLREEGCQDYRSLAERASLHEVTNQLESQQNHSGST